MEAKKKLVLIVEDDEATAITEKNTLEKNGFSVIIFRTGEEAVAEVIINRDIDIIIMDLELGNGMDGVKASELILQRRELPIVFCTGHNEEEYIEKVKNVSKYGYILKSNGNAVLIETLQIALDLFQKEKELKESKRTLQNERERLIDIIDGTREASDEVLSFFPIIALHDG